jgi:hypothetical protein
MKDGIAVVIFNKKDPKTKKTMSYSDSTYEGVKMEAFAEFVSNIDKHMDEDGKKMHKK